MKSRTEYRERKMKYLINACFSWAKKSEEERAWYASRGMPKDVYIRKHSRNNRRLDRLHQYIKKHGILPIPIRKRIRKGKFPVCNEIRDHSPDDMPKR